MNIEKPTIEIKNQLILPLENLDSIIECSEFFPGQKINLIAEKIFQALQEKSVQNSFKKNKGLNYQFKLDGIVFKVHPGMNVENIKEQFNYNRITESENQYSDKNPKILPDNIF